MVLSGSEEDCTEEIGAFKRAVEEMQSVVDVHMVHLKEDEINQVRPSKTALT